MAFEAIVKKQITRLREPSLKCIDLVVAELSNVVRMTAEKVDSNPQNTYCLFCISNPFQFHSICNPFLFLFRGMLNVELIICYIVTHHKSMTRWQTEHILLLYNACFFST